MEKYHTEKYKLYDAEFKFMSIIWDHEPLLTRELVQLCAKHLGWKRTTTYTVLRKLIDRDFVVNENSTVHSLVKREQVQKYESEAIIQKAFNGSLPRFVAAFLNGKTLSEKEAEEMKRLIELHKEGPK